MQASSDRPVHERLARLRAIGLTQKAIADAIGIKQPTVSNLFKPVSPGMKSRRVSAKVSDGVNMLELKYQVALSKLPPLKLAA